MTPSAHISIMRDMQDPLNNSLLSTLYFVNISSPRHISGAKKAGVPAVFASSSSSSVSLELRELGVLLEAELVLVLVLVPLESTSLRLSVVWSRMMLVDARDTPKSEILTTSSADMSRFAGLISRWMMPW